MKTKIVVTVGPAIDSEDMLRKMVEQGVRIFRLNSSHGDRAYFEKVIGRLKALEAELDLSLSLMQDLSGPKIRIGEIPEAPWDVYKDDQLIMGLPGRKNDYESSLKEENARWIDLDHPEMLEVLAAGDTVTLSDGGLQFHVTEKIDAHAVRLKAHNSGLLASKKGVAFPGKVSPLPAFTPKDRQDLAYGLELGVNVVALSFVQNAQDVESLINEMERLGHRVPVIAKLERLNAVENLQEILKLADGIMVARGDLGLECPLASLPGLQKEIIKACNQAGKPVIVATQMLLSMVENPVPTRAEITDVANAILDGTDCVMLSEESAIGNYPLATVQQMIQIGNEAEKFAARHNPGPIAPRDQSDPAWFLAYAACLLAEKANVRALVAHSMSGATIRHLSACRPEQPLYALSTDPLVRQFLNFSKGVLPYPVKEQLSDHLDRTEYFVDSCREFATGEAVVITAGQPKPRQERTATNLVKIYVK
ncbi:pyruvate kinase [Desulfonatronum thiosulfatophilum]|uniref:Pyruvate kinase n=1 Tax=Desulfonatronum thiosulfatophilum TaxID=617002 RepID=A0A1G6ENS1_9BACT|nr:pyruvate kinase [Desulfonatronum thiosulfatophilum]SDB59173.1 pyruvate kinase [Desulfonatronum thiosulfatophilum]